MIDIKTWMDNFTEKLVITFGNRVWFIGLQGSYGRGEATETSDGNTGDVYCIDCGHLIEKGQVIPATGGGGGEEPGGEG